MQGVVSPRTPASDPRLQGPPVVRAEHGSEQQLLEACELLLLQRCFRELLLEEFVTTLHLVGLGPHVHCFATSFQSLHQLLIAESCRRQALHPQLQDSRCRL